MDRYRPDIDGLRSVAVIPVILFHLGYEWINGGYFGVDVFFVISGYLITSIIIKEIGAERFSMKEFWLRRIRRILPALMVIIGVTLISTPFFIFRGDIPSITDDSLAALFSYANIHALLKLGDYWGSSAESSFFLHAWSLSVEEQFYVVYPLFLLCLFKLGQSFSKGLIVIVLLSFLAFLLGCIYRPVYTFYLLPTRAWEMASGGILAVIGQNANISQRIHNRYATFFSASGLVLILISYFVLTGERGINIYAFLPVLGTILIIAFSSDKNVVGRFLSSKILVFIGKISYSLYLWHWPIIVLLQTYYVTKLNSSEIKVCAAVLTMLFATSSYYLVENKTRRWKYTPRLVLVSMAVLVGYAIFLKSAMFNTFYPSTFNKTAFYGLYYDITPIVEPVSEANRSKREGIIAPERPDSFKDAYRTDGIIAGDSNVTSEPKIVTIGDSHGAMWAKVIDEISDEVNIKASFYTSVGVSPFFNLINLEDQKSIEGFSKEQRSAYAQGFIANLITWKPELLIIACKWSSLDEERWKSLQNLVEFAGRNGIECIILTQPPIIDAIGDRNSAQYLTYLGYQPNNSAQYISIQPTIEKVNENLKDRLTMFKHLSFFDVYSAFSNLDERQQKTALVIKGKDVLYYDDDHLSYQGTLLLKARLKKRIEKVL